MARERTAELETELEETRAELDDTTNESGERENTAANAHLHARKRG